MNREYQKLEYPKLIELQNDLTFIIATEIDVSLVDKGLLFMRGHIYDYENAEVIKRENKVEICHRVNEASYDKIDEFGNLID